MEMYLEKKRLRRKANPLLKPSENNQNKHSKDCKTSSFKAVSTIQGTPIVLSARRADLGTFGLFIFICKSFLPYDHKPVSSVFSYSLFKP